MLHILLSDHPCKSIKRLQDSCTKINFSFNSCSGGCGSIFDDNYELSKAIQELANDPAAAIQRYGSINCWDVSGITDMS
jgi:hypothetical protein